MGTFIIRPTALASGGTPFLYSSTVTDFDNLGYALWGIWSPTPKTILSMLNTAVFSPSDQMFYADSYGASSIPAASDTVRLDCVGACIYLDGSLTPVAFNDLPSGFTALTASIKLTLAPPPYDATSHAILYLQQGIGVNGPASTYSFPYSLVPSMLDIVNNGFGIRIDIEAYPGSPTFAYGVGMLVNGRIEGTYGITAYTFDILTPSPINIGDEVEITSDGGGDGVEEITLEYTDGNGDPQTITIDAIDFVSQSPTSVIFIIPSSFGIFQGTVTISVVGDGIIFSGTVLAGTLTILYASASGIYRIVSGKTNDTLYNRTVTGDTLDVKIPNPLAKTGFVP